ncbi:MAG: tRNA 2-thiouridine(34) synthase MnmA, partial [Pseudomonadota bacterium]
IAKHEDDNLLLLSGVDSNKDQSYFLHGLNQQQLASSIFPLGDLSKVQVREIARDLKLTIHDKKDSTGICFIGERKFREFLENYLDNKQGEIVDTEGKLLGHHQGVTFYTLGQRQGLGIGGMTHAKDQPWYVVDKDLDQNRLIVAQGNEHTRLFNSGLIMQNMHWINPDYPVPDALSAKIRYRQAPQQCKISALNDQNYQIDFDQSQRAVTPGQYAVLYDDNVCLGGGVIHQRL